MVDLYRVILRLAGRSSVLLIALPILIAVLAAVYLEYQREIINGLIGDMTRPQLLIMGAQFLGVILLSSGLKFALNYWSLVLGESFTRKLRKQLFASARNTNDPKSGRSTGQGSVLTMISNEAEEVGKFASGAISTPIMQMGILISVIVFIAVTQPILGLFVISVVGVQAVIVLSVQKQINVKVGERVKTLRRSMDRIVAGDLKQEEQAVFADFDAMYEARRSIFLFKQSSKFALNALNGIGTVGVLVLGGLLVLEGQTDIGTVTADLAGLARIAQPWRELISFFRSKSSVRVRYELLKTALPR